MQTFTQDIVEIIQNIPEGKVATYGSVAAMAGRPKGARQVSWTIHTMTKKYNLPWFRVINSKGMISIPKGCGYEEQKTILESEGVRFDEGDKINLKEFLWTGED